MDGERTRPMMAPWWLSVLLALTLPAAGQVVINEFQARNAVTLTNALGDTADWIELYNPTPTPIELGGWLLTDTAGDLTKWTFPGTNLAAYGYLLVYASGSEASVVGHELHANFKLDAEGEYLALVEPDGVTIASAYAPAFPEQIADVSFGLRPGTETIPLVASNAACRFKIPVDASDGTNWFAQGFDDAGWGQGQFGLGYESAPGDFAGLIATPVPTPTRSVYIRCLFTVDQAALLDTLRLRLKVDDGFVAYLNGARVAAENAPVALDWSAAAVAEQTNAYAVIFADFDLTSCRNLLTNGVNVLAIHLLNAPINPRLPSDLLLIPELLGERFTPSTNGEWRYFHQPTPGAQNVLGTLDVVQPIAFGVARGFRDAPFDLALNTPTPGAAIRYTTDSTAPTAATGTLYTGPFPVTHTTVVRARAFKAGYEPSAVATHTYLFAADIVAAPIMSTTITQDPVYGPQMTNALRALPSLSLATVSTTIEWQPELPTSVEWIWPDGREGFQADAGIARFGNYWAKGNYAKRMFRLYFRQRYGAGKLRYPIFEGFAQGVEPVTEFDQLDLRSGSQDMLDRGFYMSGAFCDDAMLEMGHLNPHGRFVHVYINGQYWGVYHLHERWKANTLAAYLGGDAADYQADNNDGTMSSWHDETIAPVDGDGAVWTRLVALRTHYQAQRAYLDVPQFLDYMLMWLLGSAESEFRGVGPIAANAGGYRMWLKDPDGWLRGGGAHAIADPGPGGLLSGLQQEQDPDYLVLQRDRVYRNCFGDGPLTPARNRARLMRRCAEMESAFPAEAARWGYRTPASWATERDAALARFETQTAQLIAALRAAGWYPQDAPEFSPAGGAFTGAVTIAMSVTNGAPIYYTLDGEDPRQAGTGAIAGRPYTAPVPLVRATRVKARALNGSTWGALQEALYVPAEPCPLRLTELMYHPRNPDPAQTHWTAADFEFIELRNTGTATLGLDGLRFTDGITFDFTLGAVRTMAPGSFVLVVANRAAFAARYPAVPATCIAGEFMALANWPAQTLADDGERVRLVDGLDRDVLNFAYGDGCEWPLAADGAGHSLVPLQLDNQSEALECGGNWRAGAYRDGSPGAIDPVTLRDVVINEIVAHTDYSNAVLPEYDSNDWLELFNCTAAPIGLGDWYLSDRADDLKFWPIPATNLLADGGRIVFDEIYGFHSPITNGFGLNKAGDQVFLSYLPGDRRDRVADAVRFDGQENGVSLGRYPDGEPCTYAMPPSPGAANLAPLPSVVISELMFHPPDTNAADEAAAEFVELYNPQAVTANLWSIDGPWRLAGGVSRSLPAGTSLAPGARLALVAFDPASNSAARATFLAAYALTNGEVRLLGPYDGKLNNRGERVALEKPLAPDLPGDPLLWVVVDDVIYADRAPWPAGADGTGRALARADARISGRDPRNWYTAPPTPGRPPDRVTLAAPEDDGIVWAPGPLTLRAVVDPGQAAAPPAQVAFEEGTNTLGAPAAAPFAYDWSIPNPGRYALRAALTDAEGTWTSRTVSVTALAISNAPASEITDTSAILNGRLEGGAAADVRVYWGRSDGGTDPSAWESSAWIGELSNAVFAVTARDLEPNRAYFVRTSARIGSQLGWSTPAAFTTLDYGQWSFTTRIRFDGYSDGEVLHDFPALVVFGPHLAGFSYTQAGNDGASLRFTDNAGMQRLEFDVDTWDTNGISTVWVRLPSLAAGTAIRAYWGSPGGTNVPAAAHDGSDCWEAYEAVWHLGETCDNAATPGAPALNQGTTVTAGIIGSARAFDGTNACIVPATGMAWYSQHLDAQTWSLWARPANAVANGATVIGADGGPNRLYLALNTSPRVPSWTHGAGNTEWAGAPYALDTWQMVAMVLSNGMVYAQLNDGALTSLGPYATFTLTNWPTLGRRGGAGNPYAGALDEVRVAPVARSAAWLRTEYRSAAAPLEFATYASVQTVDRGDIDGDGMPDAWERQHFGNTASNGDDDTDGDGMSDAGEYIAGTDPTNAASVFRLEIETGQGGPEVLLPMQAAQGTGYEDRMRFYDLLAAPELMPSGWTPVPGCTDLPGEDHVFIHTNTPELALSNRFFRSHVRLRSVTP